MHDPSPTVILEALQVRDLVQYLDVICQRHHVTREEVCGRGRTRVVALARHELWWELRHHGTLAFSYEEIGRLFGRNHTTVLHGVRAFQKARRRLASCA